jgi:hypothetical protein
MPRDEALMLVRLSMQAIGAILAYRGIGDAVLWEALAGLAVSGAGLAWSWRARKALRDQVEKLPEMVRGIARETLGRQ